MELVEKRVSDHEPQRYPETPAPAAADGGRFGRRRRFPGEQRPRRHLAESQRTAIKACEENRDTPTSNILQDILDETEKRTWFLYEVSQGGRNVE